MEELENSKENRKTKKLELEDRRIREIFYVCTVLSIMVVMRYI